jgi:hypothetical protein
MCASVAGSLLALEIKYIVKSVFIVSFFILFDAGNIRSWYWFSDYGVVVYNIIGNRYCENIGRQHKSNNGMYMDHTLF